MFRIVLNKKVAVGLIAFVLLLARPIPVFANDGCNLLSIIFGGDCVATLDAGITTRTEIRENGETDRVELTETNATERTALEQAGMTDRVTLEQMQETQRVLMQTEALRDIASQQTTQVLANALAAQNSVDRLASATESVVLYQAQYDLLQKQLATQAQAAWINQAINFGRNVLLLSMLFLIMVWMMRRRTVVIEQRTPQRLAQQQLSYYNPHAIVHVTKEVNRYDESTL